MNKKLLTYLSIILLCLSGNLFSQTYQLTGNPVNTTGWDVVPSAVVNTDFIELTADLTGKVGGIKLNAPINLKYCNKWRVEFDFRIDGNGTTSYGRGDGFAFWYLANPPASYVTGGGLGIPANATGLMVGFDIFNNTTEGQMSKVHLLYGTNNTAGSNIEYNNTPGSTFHSADLNPTQPFVGATYKHVEVTGEVDPANAANWIIVIKIDGTTIVSQSFAPSGTAVGMTQGYFGFSASTGAASARHSIKNVKVYTEKVAILQSSVSQSFCANPSTGYGTVNLTSFNSQFVSTPSNYTFTYYVTGNPTPIANPANYQFNANTSISVTIKDNSTILCDNPDGKILLSLSPFDATDTTLTECNNNNAGTATYNLTTANVTSVPGVTKKYYPTLNNANAGTNEIINPTSYNSGAGAVYVKVTTPQGCTDIAKITLAFHPVTLVRDATLESCFIETNQTSGTFNLTSANITSDVGITKKFYTSLANALSGTNEIANPTVYISPGTTIYVKVTNIIGCFSIAKINLIVLPPVTSSVLKDKTICMGDTTNLDAGSGFDGYLWSTGETTQSIQNVPVGLYWVKLKTRNCTTTQTVQVKASVQPVISGIDINNSSITVNVTGGTAPYKYSLDGIKWQDSNIFSGLPRGEVKVFVKDSFNCPPISVQITVPNLINAITPNGDNVNDIIDYSALAYKKNVVFIVYDRYGNKLYQADKTRDFKWDGTAFGKKIITGTYWYSISWNENDKNNTETKYSGWVLVKNRE